MDPRSPHPASTPARLSVAAGSTAADKIGFIGSLVSAMGCVNCFPALASIGTALGLGVLAPHEGLLIRILLPLFAIIALVANLVAWRSHRHWYRRITALLGPVLVLLAVLVMRVYGVRTGWLLYPGLALMLATSILDLASPGRRCRVRAAHHISR